MCVVLESRKQTLGAIVELPGSAECLFETAGRTCIKMLLELPYISIFIFHAYFSETSMCRYWDEENNLI